MNNFNLFNTQHSKLKTNNSVSLLGCGWLGLPTAIKLHNEGFEVKVSTTSTSKLEVLISQKLTPFLINLNPEINDLEALTVFLEADTLIINIPPGKASSAEFHPTQIKNILPYIQQSKIEHVIYVSATSVYFENNQEVFEEEVINATQAANQKLAQAEDLIKSLKDKHITILRYGGLVGGSRNLLKFFQGKTDLAGGNIPVNLIHQNDAVNILSEVVTKQIWDKTYNVCARIHPTKKEFYTHLAEKFNAIAPTFLENDKSSFKIINADKITKALNYQFEFSNPLDFEYE